MELKTLEEIKDRIIQIKFNEEFEFIVAIARGGIFPAALLQQKLGIGLEIIWLNFRDEKQQPQYDEPRLVKAPNFEFKGKKILLVDDRSRTGSTFRKAKELLSGSALIKSLVVNGNADYSLFNETCFIFPWRLI
jgi:hypoxanthine phosphoribosyltransferase